MSVEEKVTGSNSQPQVLASLAFTSSVASSIKSADVARCQRKLFFLHFGVTGCDRPPHATSYLGVKRAEKNIVFSQLLNESRTFGHFPSVQLSHTRRPIDDSVLPTVKSTLGSWS